MTSNAKILLFDLETTANKGFYWGQNWETSIIETIEYWKLLSLGAKWLGSDKVIFKGWLDSKNELGVVKALWKLLNEADIVIAHNGKNFDIKKANTKFAEFKLGPPSPYKVIDTKIEAKKYISLPSYKLNDIADYFGLGHKVEHEGWSLWKKCIAREKQAWKTMRAYNIHDVNLLESVYLELRPFMTTHPNIGMYKKPDGLYCPKCGSKNLNWEGWHRNKTTKYHSFSCKDCGGWGRDSKNVQDFKNLVSI